MARLGQVGKLKQLAQTAAKVPSPVEKLGKLNKSVGKLNNLGGSLKRGGSRIVDRADDLISNDGLSKGVKGATKSIGKNMRATGAHMESVEQFVEFNVPKAVGNAVNKSIRAAGNFAGSLVEQTDKNLIGVKLNTRGKIVVGGAAIASGTRDAAKQYNETTMGRRDGQITPHAPRIPAYANNGGATGDLVFALNANRRG